MAQAKSAYELRKAINSSKKCFIYTVFGCTADGTQLGGYIEAFKSHLLGMMKEFKLPTQSWDKTTVRCYFRTEPETGYLYIEGFHAG
jgi:hypothetical protein